MITAPDIQRAEQGRHDDTGRGPGSLVTICCSALALAAALATGCGAPLEAPLATPDIDTLPGGVVHVRNSGPSAWRDTGGWRLVLDLVIQPPEGDPFEIHRGYRFQGSNLVAVDHEGRIYLADGPPAIVLVFGPDGRGMARVGREGDGPGEFRAPGVLVVRDTLVVPSGEGHRAVTTFRLDGTPIARWHAPSGSWVGPAHGDTTGAMTLLDLLAQPPALRRVGLDGAPRPGFKMPRSAEPPGTTHPEAILVTTEGYLVAGLPQRGRWAVVRAPADTLRIVVAPDGIVPLTDSAIAAARERERLRQQNPMLRQMGGGTPRPIPSHTPSWGAPLLDQDGRWWIGRHATTGAIDRWDLFTADGVLLGAVARPPELAHVSLTALRWGAGRLHAVSTLWGESERPAILVFRLETSRP